MAKKKVYAVRKGKKTGLFDNWADCQQSVTGYPGAEFKGFFSIEEAREYLRNEKENSNSSFLSKGNSNQETEAGRNCLVAYVDGSFDEKIGRYSFGCVLITPEGEKILRSGNGESPEAVAIRNVAGEMLGAMYAVKWAMKNGYSEIEICYDYQGIEKWAVGEWKTNHIMTQKYAQFMAKSGENVRIDFRKVKAHSGNYYNEQADKLAKAALTQTKGIPGFERDNEEMKAGKLKK